MSMLRRLIPAMWIWLTLLVVWALYLAAGGSLSYESTPWLLTVGCWMCLDFRWVLAPRGAQPAVGVSLSRLGALVLAIIPHALYCLPLTGVPILGQRLIPRLPALEMVGVVMCVGGVGLAVWARRIIAKNWSGTITIPSQHTLVQKGPYAIVRHPIYLGLLLSQAGMILALGELRGLVFVLGIERLLRKTIEEDIVLRTAYPVEYGQYERRVKRLVPWIW
jgi:protein-S-isoprenylcysteine O-methyltransferase Ste14